jgi:uncharacterized membrane protein YoaK (UPF0700 family)
MKSISDDLKKAEKKFLLHESIPFGILLSIVGGFLDAYTYISRHRVFANAQTGNIVLLGIHASKGEWMQVLIYLPPIFAFILGVVVVERIKTSSKKLVRFEWEQVILILEILILFILGFIPANFPDIIVTVTISFVASVQVCSFSKLVDSAYATTMMTGNLRKFSTEAYHAIAKKDHESAVRALRYLAVILSFILGAVIGGVLTILTGIKAIWGVALLLIFPVLLIGIAEHDTSEAK